MHTALSPNFIQVYHTNSCFTTRYSDTLPAAGLQLVSLWVWRSSRQLTVTHFTQQRHSQHRSSTTDEVEPHLQQVSSLSACGCGIAAGSGCGSQPSWA
jgi:hypothetical protein